MKWVFVVSILILAVVLMNLYISLKQYEVSAGFSQSDAFQVEKDW